MRLLLFMFAIIFVVVGCGSKYERKPKVDPKIEVAIAAARASLTNFISALQRPPSNRMYYRVLTSFPTNQPVQEAVWVMIWKYDNGSFIGTLPNPNPKTGLTNNQQISINASDVFDWAYMDVGKLGSKSNKPVGDFLERALLDGSNNALEPPVTAPSVSTNK